MADPLSTKLLTLALSYEELGNMGFDPAFIEDYLNQIRNAFTISNEVDFDKAAIESNTQRLDVAEPKIESNTDRLDIAEPIIESNTQRLDVAEPIIADNTDRLDLLEPRVAQNETDISQNASDILQNANDLSAHELLNSAHGVTGNNVGTGDYCTLSVGGVVNLAALVNDLTQIATADIGAAPAAYDQTYTQSVTDLTNENKAKINEIVLKINEILAGQILAKQMSNV